MEKMMDKNKPVVHNWASIISSNISLRVYWKEQLLMAILWLVKNEYSFQWEKVYDTDKSMDVYYLTAEIPWANNLAEFAEILKKCDYQQDTY